MIYFCCDQYRRNAVRGSALNGIDYLEVVDSEAPSEDQRQRLLTVHFVNDLTGSPLTKGNFRVDGGERIRNIQVIDTTPGTEDNVLRIEVDNAGDFSKYTLRLVQNTQQDNPPAGYDPRLSSIDFSFKVECPSDFDCRLPRTCPEEPVEEPDINYLAKDYASFRRLILDRMALLMPDWKERNPADSGIALVELLAYVGDYLSYQQDAVATEAYLGTARRRTSVRRHALLVDYHMHNGCNARTWVQIQVETDITKISPDDPPRLPKGTALCTGIPGQPVLLSDDPAVLHRARVVYETMHAVDEMFAAHNNISFYTWSDHRCCLPEGATRATLKGHFPNLKAGDVLILEEILGPATGKAEDADIGHRHPIRLTEVICTDADDDPLIDPLNGQEITEIGWSSEDALPFPVCISTITDEAHGKQYIEDVSIAHGNIVLADHGITIKDEAPDPDTVPEPIIYNISPDGNTHCDEHGRIPIPPRFRPKLPRRPLTHAAPYDSSAPAYAAMQWEAEDSLPEITLQSTLHTVTDLWHPKRDLLSSNADAKEFVAEVESDGTVYLRFGDGRHGARPQSMTKFEATYRIGNGADGNIGAGAIKHIQTNLTGIIGVRNPLPAHGGIEPESTENVRQRAPSAFRTQKRAVTERIMPK
jgi:hypothetical protein